MISLNEQQRAAVNQDGHVMITACPGSGKTRVLTCRIMRGLQELESSKERVVALTFTNRATDEIQTRLDQEDIAHGQLWSGTIHAFALEWILRPYAPYLPRIRRGFFVADEYFAERELTDLKDSHGKPSYFDVCTARDRHGNVPNTGIATKIFVEYQARLIEAKLLDYDDILHHAYQLLQENDEIPATLARIIRLICVDEIQDTQELQYGILSSISKATGTPPTIFLVGDQDQAIYESLGAVTKGPQDIAEDFALDNIAHMELSGNYRSTQRIIDFYRQFRPYGPAIQSLTDYSEEDGLITFHNRIIGKDDLPATIATIIRSSLDAGIPPDEICVVAPHWWHVRALARSLVQLLPDVDFDAPGLSPLHSQRENIWFKIARLFLTTPTPSMYRTRLRWAREVITELTNIDGLSLQELQTKPRSLLRLTNSITSDEETGLDYLEDVFNEFMDHLSIVVDTHVALADSRVLFFEKARARIEDAGTEATTVIAHFRKLFRHPSGVVISTCHGVKGEEYDTVIAFGLLKGYVPNWQVIMNGSAELATDRESKLLYVVCSRARCRLHLISEAGRFSQSRCEYETATLLRSVKCDYDPAP